MTVKSTFTATFSGENNYQEWATANLTLADFTFYPEIQTLDHIQSLVDEKENYIRTMEDQVPGLLQRIIISDTADTTYQEWTWTDAESFNNWHNQWLAVAKNTVVDWIAFEAGKKNTQTEQIMPLSATEYAYFLYKKAINLNVVAGLEV